MIKNSKIHSSVKIWHPSQVNIYNSEIGEGTTIASFVEIGGAKIGKHCAIGAFSFIPPGSVIEDNVFIGPNVTLTNDRYPKAQNKDWTCRPVTIKEGASIGAGSVLCPGVTVESHALVGAGSVVAEDVAPYLIICGNKARFNGNINLQERT